MPSESADHPAAPAVAEPSPRGRAKAAPKAPAAPLPFEAELWNAADKMRGQVEESEYKHVVLGLIFLKYISDAFDHRRIEIAAEVADPGHKHYLDEEADRAAALEDRDYYRANSVAWVPADARWQELQKKAKASDIGLHIDAAMDSIEAENHDLKGVLPKNYARPEIPSNLLGQLIDLFSKIGMHSADGREDILGRVYEYFLGRFGANEGGQYYTPQQVVRLLVEMLEPYKGRIFDPACGSGGMFVQSARFVEAHGGGLGNIHVFGQESVATTWRLAKMNLAIRHIDADLGESWADSFHDDRHKDLRADFVIANPPFNLDEWDGDKLKGDPRWVYGDPPAGNANFAWVQHFLAHLAPTGTAGFILANGALSVGSAEAEIRKKIIEADLVDCIVSLPTNLFFSTTIPVALWFLTKNKKANGHRDRTGETLFIDARSLGSMATRVQRVLSKEDVARVAGAYRAWRTKDGGYENHAGFCQTATLQEMRDNNWFLAPSRYVPLAASAESAAEIDERIERLTEEVLSALDRTTSLAPSVRAALKRVGPTNG